MDTQSRSTEAEAVGSSSREMAPVSGGGAGDTREALAEKPKATSGDTLRMKLLLSVFDKGILTVFAAVVVFLFQQNVNEEAVSRDLMLKVAGIHAEIVKEQRKELMKAAAAYLSHLRRFADGGQWPTSEQSMALTELRERVAVSTDNIEGIYEGFAVSTSGMRRALVEASINLGRTDIRGLARMKMLQKDEHNIRTEFGSMLQQLRTASIEAVRKDVDIALEAWRRETWWSRVRRGWRGSEHEKDVK